MAANFPNSPSVGQIYQLGTAAWKWNGSAWDTVTLPNDSSAPVVNNAGAATGTLNIDVATANTHLYGTTTASTGTFGLNFRGDASTTLNNLYASFPRETLVTVINFTGATTASYPNSFSIDGVALTTSGAGQNIFWQGGSAPTAGNANAKDSYVFEIIKTAASTWVVFASQTKYA